MKTSVYIIKRMARLGIINTEPVKFRKADDIIIKNEMGEERKVIVDGLTDEDLPILIALEQFEVIKSIKSMIKFVMICGIVAAIIWWLVYLLELGSGL